MITEMRLYKIDNGFVVATYAEDVVLKIMSFTSVEDAAKMILSDASLLLSPEQKAKLLTGDREI